MLFRENSLLHFRQLVLCIVIADRGVQGLQSKSCRNNKYGCSSHFLRCTDSGTIILRNASFVNKASSLGCARISCSGNEFTNCCNFHRANSREYFDESLMNKIEERCANKSTCAVDDLLPKADFSLSVIEYNCTDGECVNCTDVSDFKSTDVIAAVVGSVLPLIVIIIVVVFCLHRQLKKKPEKKEEPFYHILLTSRPSTTSAYDYATCTPDGLSMNQPLNPVKVDYDHLGQNVRTGRNQYAVANHDPATDGSVYNHVDKKFKEKPIGNAYSSVEPQSYSPRSPNVVSDLASGYNFLETVRPQRTLQNEYDTTVNVVKL